MTIPTTRTLATGLAAGALVFAAFAPTASAQRQDLRSPDARDAAVQSVPQSVTPQDLRSPDARDAAVQSVRPSVAPQDLRSPDTRDTANNYSPTYVPEPTTVSVPSSDGFDWVSAAIGAAAIGGLILVLLAGVGTRRHVRHRPVLD